MTSTLLPVEAVEVLVQGISTLSASNPFACLQNVVEQHAELTREYKNLETTNKTIIRNAAKVQDELEKAISDTKKINLDLEESKDKAKSLQEKIHNLEGQVAKKQQELESTTEVFSKLQEELKKREGEVISAQDHAARESARADSASEVKSQVTLELKNTQQQLDHQLAKITQLESYKIKQLEAPPHAISKLLRGIWNVAYSLVSGYFNVDLSGETFSNAEPWTILRSRLANEQIPINPSNSTIAKRMRVSAALKIMSNVLYVQIFQPNYVLAHSGELTDMLDELLTEDFEREQHLRAELLALDPERQKENGEVRIKNAVADIISCCEVMVPSDRHADFRDALEKFCRQALAQWTQLQPLLQRVEPSFNPDDNDKWFLLPPPKKHSQNGNTSPQQGNTAEGAEAATTARRNGSIDMEEAAISDIEVVVWPCFILTDLDGYQALNEGFVLNNSQIQEAADDQSTFVTRKPSRSVRQGYRRTRSNSIVVNSDGNQGTGNKVFLSGNQPGNSQSG